MKEWLTCSYNLLDGWKFPYIEVKISENHIPDTLQGSCEVWMLVGTKWIVDSAGPVNKGSDEVIPQEHMLLV